MPSPRCSALTGTTAAARGRARPFSSRPRRARASLRRQLVRPWWPPPRRGARCSSRNVAQHLVARRIGSWRTSTRKTHKAQRRAVRQVGDHELLPKPCAPRLRDLRVAVARQVGQVELVPATAHPEEIHEPRAPRRATRRGPAPCVRASAFRRLLLPTFERPRNATSGSPSRGNCAGAAALPAKVEAVDRVRRAVDAVRPSRVESRRLRLSAAPRASRPSGQWARPS